MPPAPVKIAITGATGRMGKQLVTATLSEPRAQLTSVVVSPTSPLARTPLVAAPQLQYQTATRDALNDCEVLIDFTTPSHTLNNLVVCAQTATAMVIGTTGFDADGKTRITDAAQQIPIVLAANTSVGINAMLEILGTTTRMLGEDTADVEILETHHRDKVDAPSGTALAIGEVIAQAREATLSDCAIYHRHGHTGIRPEGAISFASLRGGDVVGEHTVRFLCAGEIVEITHRACDRSIFARGALRAALWLQSREPGLYAMSDVLQTS